jgi:Tol biopolymer transport system component
MDARQGRWPSWSPDGRWIIFEFAPVPGGNFQIFVAPAPGADVPPMDPRPLTDPSYKSREAQWSRQQDRIVFRKGFCEAIGIFEVPEEFR